MNPPASTARTMTKIAVRIDGPLPLTAPHPSPLLNRERAALPLFVVPGDQARVLERALPGRRELHDGGLSRTDPDLDQVLALALDLNPGAFDGHLQTPEVGIGLGPLMEIHAASAGL